MRLTNEKTVDQCFSEPSFSPVSTVFATGKKKPPEGGFLKLSFSLQIGSVMPI